MTRLDILTLGLQLLAVVLAYLTGWCRGQLVGWRAHKKVSESLQAQAAVSAFQYIAVPRYRNDIDALDRMRKGAPAESEPDE